MDEKYMQAIKSLSCELYMILKEVPEEIQKNVREICIRAEKPIIFMCTNDYLFLRKDGKLTRNLNLPLKIASQKEIEDSLRLMCKDSIYSYTNEIKNGFLTLKGGHRIGITGSAVIENNKVKNINYISNLNFRIARQILGWCNNIIKEIINQEENTIYNTLIVSPPGAGKTTLLRDIIRNLSNGTEEITGKNIGVVDERGELSATYKGISQNDLGIRTDVIDNIPKALGMKMLIRSMSPKVIIADEIGKKEDVDAIEYAVTSGVKGIFTAHGSDLEQIEHNPILNQLIINGYIEKVLAMDKQRNVHLLYEKQSKRKVS